MELKIQSPTHRPAHIWVIETWFLKKWNVSYQSGIQMQRLKTEIMSWISTIKKSLFIKTPQNAEKINKDSEHDTVCLAVIESALYFANFERYYMSNFLRRFRIFNMKNSSSFKPRVHIFILYYSVIWCRLLVSLSVLLLLLVKTCQYLIISIIVIVVAIVYYSLH